MDDSVSSVRKAEVSCRNIGWCFDLCAERNLDTNRVLRNVPYTRQHMQNPACFIDWQSFCTFNNNFLLYFSESEFREAGRYSWKSSSMRIYRVIGNLLYSVREQFTSAYGPLGFVAKLYPCELSLTELYPGHLKIKLRMKSGLAPCRSFHLALAGQMGGLPESLGFNDANVQLHHHDQGANFDVYYQPHGGLLAPFRRFLSRPFTIRDSAVELNLTFESLLEKYRELQTEAGKLKRSEKRASEIERRYKLLAENVSDVIWTMDLKFNWEYLSPSMGDLLGYTEDEVAKLQMSDFLHKDTVKNIETFVTQSLDSAHDLDNTITFETNLYRKDGKTVRVEVKSNFAFDSFGRPTRLVGIIRDISNKEGMEAELNRSEEEYKIITDSAQDAIFTFDEEGIITFANPATLRIFGHPKAEILGLSVKAIIPAAFNSSPNELEQLSNTIIEQTGVTRSNQNIFLEISFATHKKQGKFYVTAIARDVTEHKNDELERNKLQSQLVASQKIESIGQLTGGIAHDFNNLLVAINGYADLVLKQQTDAQAIAHYLSEIKLAGDRAADMTQKLLTFSRRQVIEPSVTNLHELVEGVRLMIQRLLPENIHIEFRHQDDAMNILADGGQIEQILVNLAINARDAMPEGGELCISSSRKIIDEDYVRLHAYAQTGKYAVIVVSDTGFGMSNETQKRIFEPFFTTKPEGLGTGLGMSVVFGIISQHKGFINVKSKKGVGSTFSVFLPITQDQVVKTKTPSTPKVIGGTENILVVEDNKQVRDLACVTLQDSGYQVFSAVDGTDAIKKFRDLASKIDLVLLDVVMPNMGGREVLEKMRLIKPGIKVIFASGYSEGGIHTDFILEQGLEFVQKPYHSALLLKKVRQILDGYGDEEVA
ncbi:MAG: PAS domain S-box protein [bacterium]